MDQAEYVFDFNRIFFGDLPSLFLAEIAFRTAVVYVFALAVVRMLGKRGMGQLAPFDFVIIIALGSAVGDPMFYRSIPLLHAMVAIAGVVVLTRLVVKLSRGSKKVKSFISSSPTRLVMDGALDLKGLQSESIARDELFEALRASGVKQLGEVERAYLEPGGQISTFLFNGREIHPGLPLLPDATPRHRARAGDRAEESSHYACLNCGRAIWLTVDERVPECTRCEGAEWRQAASVPPQT